MLLAIVIWIVPITCSSWLINLDFEGDQFVKFFAQFQSRQEENMLPGFATLKFNSLRPPPLLRYVATNPVFVHRMVVDTGSSAEAFDLSFSTPQGELM